MKYFIALFIVFRLTIINGYTQPNSGHSFIVERYRTSNYAFGGFVFTELTEKRKYSEYHDPLFTVEYHGKQLFDSTVYLNQDHKIIKLIQFDNIYGLRERENIDYIYQRDNSIDVKVVKSQWNNSTKEDYINYLPHINAYGFKDPLGLLENDFSDFEIEHTRALKKVYLNDGSQTITKQTYIINSRAQSLFTYGVPYDANLQKVNLYYTKDKLLLKDEFIYDRLVVKREYIYAPEGIKGIKILKLKNHRIISTDAISFKYIFS